MDDVGETWALDPVLGDAPGPASGGEEFPSGAGVEVADGLRELGAFSAIVVARRGSFGPAVSELA